MRSNHVAYATRATLIAAVAAFAACATTAVAEEPRAGRYSMYKADDGFVRLDTQTGAMSLCRRVDDDWSCRPMASSGAAKGSEVEQLRAENERLAAEVKRLEGLLGLEADPPRPGGDKHAFRLPSEKEVDQALDYFENMLRKFQERLKRLERGREAEPKQL